MSDGSICFDRMADRYDATRGGDERARHLAAALTSHLSPGHTTLEVGVGTGAVAAALSGVGIAAVGVDLSPAMLVHARARLGPLVSVGSGQSLPIRGEAVTAAYLVWVLHLVGDVAVVLAECARVIASGGRLLIILTSTPDPDEITDAEGDLHIRLRPKRDAPEVVSAAAVAAGLRIVAVSETPSQCWEQSPAEVVERYRRRDYSGLWDVDDARWAAEVEPVVDRLRALPDQHRPRLRVSRNPLLVFERPVR